MKFLKAKLASEKLSERIIYCLITFLVSFIIIVILSYFLLPDGFLKGKQSASFELTNSLFENVLRIFGWNLFSVVFIFIGSLFSKKRKNETNYFSTGYLVFFVLIAINAVTLGTWSFSVERAAVPLVERIIGLFDFTQNAGLLEMFGQMLILCSLATISIVRVSKKAVITKKFREIRLSKQEIVVILFGLGLMLLGAFIEGLAIQKIF